MEIEISEIRQRFVGAAGRNFTGPHETAQPLNDLDVQQVGRVQFVTVAKEAGLDSSAERRLQEKLQQRRCVDNDHVDSRSSLIMTAAGVFRVTRLRP